MPVTRDWTERPRRALLLSLIHILAQGRISNESPVGKALIGSKMGATVTVHAPLAEYDVKILEVK